jgi:multidrug efflux pump subunit AcrA (membrane-fusion protein)
MGGQAVAAAPAARPQASAVGVEFIKPKRQSVVEKVEAVGTARANESLVVAAKQTGNIARINFQEGQMVRAGAVLIELESRERAADTEAVRAEIAQSRAASDEIRQQLDRARALRASGNATEARVSSSTTLRPGRRARLTSRRQAAVHRYARSARGSSNTGASSSPSMRTTASWARSLALCDGLSMPRARARSRRAIASTSLRSNSSSASWSALDCQRSRSSRWRASTGTASSGMSGLSS